VINRNAFTVKQGTCVEATPRVNIGKRWVAAAVVILVVVIASAAYYLTLPRAPPVAYRRTLVIGVSTDNQALDPQQASWTTLVNWYAFSGYVGFDQQRNVVPDLAQSYEIQDGGRALIIKLPTDLKFSSGNPLTAEVAKEVVERYVRLSPYSTDWMELNHTEIVDDNTVKFVFNHPPGPLWAVLASEYGAPVDVETAKKLGDEQFNAQPVGAGPFIIKEWVKGSQTVLIPNPNYRTSLPFVNNKGPITNLDQVTIRVIPDDLTRVNEFLAGDVDILAAVPPELVGTIAKDPNSVLHEFAYGGLDYLALNLEKTPLDDLNVRKAIYLAMNNQEFVQANSNTTEAWYSFISRGMLCSNSTVEDMAKTTYSYNLAEANGLLDAAGWAMGGDGYRHKGGQTLTFTLDVPTDMAALRNIAPVIQAQLAKAGIKIDLKEYEYHYIRAKIWNKNFDAALNVWAWVDPDGDEAYWLHSQRAHNATYINPEVDQLFDQGMMTFDLKQRTEVYSRLQLILLRDLPGIPLQYSKSYVAVRNNVEGIVFSLHTSPLIYLNDVRVIATAKPPEQTTTT